MVIPVLFLRSPLPAPDQWAPHEVRCILDRSTVATIICSPSNRLQPAPEWPPVCCDIRQAFHPFPAPPQMFGLVVDGIFLSDACWCDFVWECSNSAAVDRQIRFGVCRFISCYTGVPFTHISLLASDTRQFRKRCSIHGLGDSCWSCIALHRAPDCRVPLSNVLFPS